MSDPPESVSESLRLIDDLKFFLATAPANWQDNQVIRRYYLNHDEGFVSCVFWNNLYFITGTDIVRCVLYKFEHFGRTVTDRKKFEEGIFSDLRNLKSGQDAVLEPPKLEFLEFLYKNLCVRTQKKQKVFYWFNVPHDKLMADALERDIKKEQIGQVPTSVALREPALLFQYLEERNRSLYDQLSDHLSLPRFETSNTEPDSIESDDTVIAVSNNANNNATSSITNPNAIKTETDNASDMDFPLDYTDKMGFISVDPNYQSGSTVNAHDTNFNSIDPAMFHHVPVATTDDYLIEQTVPVRMPRLAREDYMYHPFGLAGQFSSVGMPPMIPSGGVHYELFWLEPQDPYYDHQYYDERVAYDERVPYDERFAYDERFDNRYDSHINRYDNRHENRYDSRYDNPHDSYDTRFDTRPDSRYDNRFDGRFVPSQRQQDASASMMRKRQQLWRAEKPERPHEQEYERRMSDNLKPRDRDDALVLTPESTAPDPNAQR